jgi:Flp pilus assembly protein TadD
LQAFADKQRFADIVEIGKMKVATDPNNPQFHMSLAGAYLKMGKRADAITEIKKVIELAPEFKETGEFYIKEIQAGRDPSQAK